MVDIDTVAHPEVVAVGQVEGVVVEVREPLLVKDRDTVEQGVAEVVVEMEGERDCVLLVVEEIDRVVDPVKVCVGQAEVESEGVAEMVTEGDPVPLPHTVGLLVGDSVEDRDGDGQVVGVRELDGVEVSVAEAHLEAEGELERVMLAVPVTVRVAQVVAEMEGVVLVLPQTVTVGEAEREGESVPVMLEERVALREVVAQKVGERVAVVVMVGVTVRLPVPVEHTEEEGEMVGDTDTDPLAQYVADRVEDTDRDPLEQ